MLKIKLLIMKKILCLILSLLLGFSIFGQSTFINEINYLTPTPCIEIVTPEGTDLSGWKLHRYLSDGSLSTTQPLTGTINATEAGFDFIIVDAVIFLNGTDGIVLTDNNGQVVQFLSFGAEITATNGPANGLTSEAIGAQTLSTHSLQLTGNGTGASDFDWTTDNPSTCGLPNVDQSFALGSNGILPINLNYFKGEEQHKKVYLSWETFSEFNNDYFLLERSMDGRNWLNLIEIPGKMNSTERTTYQYFDETPAAGTRYYRLSQYDIDGKMEIFETITLRVDFNGEIKLFPNPGSDIINIKLPANDTYEDTKILIYDKLGKPVLVDTLSSSQVLEVSHLASGIYLVKIITGHKQYNMLFTKI